MRLGIKIKIDSEINSSTLHFSKVHYDIFLTTFRSKLYFSLEQYLGDGKIEKLAIKLFKSQEGETKIGFVVCEEGNGFITFPDFYPFGKGLFIPFPEFKGKRIADKIHLLIVEDLLKHFSEDSKVMHPSASRSRRRQLERMGIDYSKVYPLNEYVAIIQSRVN